mgnify:CR=1 FL=1
MPLFLTIKEQVTGTEPAYPAWEAGVLPMNYTCNKINIVQTGTKVKHRIAWKNAAKKGYCKSRNPIL